MKQATARNVSRREGFSGQRMSILPHPLRPGLLRHPLLAGLLVTDAGVFPEASGHRVERPEGAPTDLLILCLKGRGWLRTEGREQALSSGDLLWLGAGSPHAYGAAAQEPWSIAWVHFQGAEVPHWRRLLGWSPEAGNTLLHIPPALASEVGLEDTVTALERGYSLPQLLAAGASLRRVFCTLHLLSHTTGTNSSARERTARVRDQLQTSPTGELHLAQLAASAGLSVPRFSLLFRELTGYAPMDFLARQRIRHACRLLDATQSPVAAIAAEVGYSDPYYFSRCFRRIMGMSPLAYRRSIKA